MPRVSEEHREQRRTQIIEAAQRCMLARGVRGASMQDIIRESGLSAGAIYVHFDGKQEIVLEAARRALSDRLEALDAAGAAGPARFTDLIAGVVAGPTIDGSPKAPFLLQWWSEATLDDEVREIVQGIMGLVGDGCERQLRIFAERQHAMDREAATRWAARLRPVAVGVLQGAVVQGAVLDDFDLAAYLDACEPLFSA